MQLNDDFLKAVVFLGKSQQNGELLDINFGGTGFLFSVQQGATPGFGHVFLVTAKHVALQFKNEEFAVVTNTRNGGTGGTRVVNPKWLFHENHSVDLALLPMPSKIIEFDTKWISENDVVTEDEIASRRIAVGDITQAIGLFSRVPGKIRISPVVRTGNVAMFPTEKIPSRIGDIEAYLVEARSLGEISGSPVFVQPTLALPTDQGLLIGSQTPKLLGVMHGHWDIPMEDEGTRAQHVNMGLSIVVPAKFILDITRKFVTSEAT